MQTHHNRSKLFDQHIHTIFSCVVYRIIFTVYNFFAQCEGQILLFSLYKMTRSNFQEFCWVLLTVVILAVTVGMDGVHGQEGTEATPAPPQSPLPRYESNNATGQLVIIPPVPLAFTYPGPLPVPGVSWPILGGINYIAEGRFPYNGYVGAQSPQLHFVSQIRQPQPYRRKRETNVLFA